MQNKHFIHYTIGALVGILIGFLIWHGAPSRDRGYMSKGPQGMHMMPDGSMMGNNGMSMGDMMASMNADLVGKTGDEFDEAFITEMIVHHQGAVDMAQLALTHAKHQEIKDLANSIIKAQTTEIAQMKGWLKSWYNK